MTIGTTGSITATIGTPVQVSPREFTYLISSITGAGTYSFQVNANGEFGLAVNTGAFTDLAGNDNDVSLDQSLGEFTKIKPRVTITGVPAKIFTAL